MKSFVLVLLLLGAATFVVSRPSASDTSTVTNGEPDSVLKRDQRHLHGFQKQHSLSLETSRTKIAFAKSETHGLHAHHLHRPVSHSKTHSFSKTINLPHLSLSVAHSKTKVDTLGR